MVSNRGSQDLGVTVKQAELLRGAMSIEGIEGCGESVFRLNRFLKGIIRSQEDAETLPAELHAVTHDVAKLVLKTELDHTAGLIESELIGTLDGRLNSGFGLVVKYELLKDFITPTQPAQQEAVS